MSEDVLQRKHVELMAQNFLKGPKGEQSIFEKKSNDLFKTIMDMAKKRKELKPDADEQLCMFVSLCEMFTKLQVIENLRFRLIEKTVEALAESLEGEVWKNAMIRISKLE